MSMLPSYRNQPIDCAANRLTGFYMRATLAFNGLVLLGDFNVKSKELCIQSFLQLYGLKNLITKTARYKNLEKTFSIDLILTSGWSRFQCSCVIKTGLCDFRKMNITIMKTTFQKLKLKNRYKMIILEKNFRRNYQWKTLVTGNGLEKFLQICIGVTLSHFYCFLAFSGGVQKTYCFLTFSGSIEMWYLTKMGT